MNTKASENYIMNQDIEEHIKDFIKSFFGNDSEKVLKKIEKLKMLPLGKFLYIYDFDDTFYSRTKKEGLKNNRGEFGNKWILAKYSGIWDEEWNNIFLLDKVEYKDSVSLDKNHITFEENAKILGKEILEKFINNVFRRIDKLSNKKIRKIYKRFVLGHYSKIKENNTRIGLVNNIQEIVNEVKNSLIITVGNKYLQQEKIKAVGIDNIQHSIVHSGKDKIKSLIEKVLELGYIPEKIVVYEDRPEYFFKYGEILSRLLGTKIVVNKVKINEESNNLEILESRNFAFVDFVSKKQDIVENVDNYVVWNIS